MVRILKNSFRMIDLEHWFPICSLIYRGNAIHQSYFQITPKIR